MIKSWATLVLLFLILTRFSAGQISESTYFSIDGNFWKEVEDVDKSRSVPITKAALISGIILGSKSQVLGIKVALGEDSATILLKSMDENPLCIGDIGKIDSGQLLEGVDKVYKDYANTKLPVIVVIALVSKRIKGKIGDQEYSTLLQKMRGTDWRKIQQN